MYYLDTWRCQSCPRILARDLRLGDGSRLAAVCWGCGAANVVTVGDPVATAGPQTFRPMPPDPNDATGGYVFVGEGAQEMADAVTKKLAEAPTSPKGTKGKVREAVGSDGGFAVKGQ